jgi:L-ascorbate metabolism protein UlaG (beta-lactamase superfamily)
MMPSEVLQAAQDLQTKRLLPVHWSKFKLALHGWTEPIETLLSLNNEIKLPILKPMIGEKLLLKDDQQVFTEWWKNI